MRKLIDIIRNLKNTSDPITQIKNNLNCINTKNSENLTPLLILIKDSYFYKGKLYDLYCQVLDLLIESKADLNAKNSLGETALMILCSSYHADNNLILILLRAGASTQGALSRAIKYGNTVTVYYLLEYKAFLSIEEKNELKWTCNCCRYVGYELSSCCMRLMYKEMILL